MKDISQLDITGKQTFIRVDFNIPLKEGKVQDDTRIRGALPTIEMAVNKGAKVILASHLGRPKGEKVPEMSLKPVADYIKEKFFPIQFVPECIGPEVINTVSKMENGQVVLLENLRYHPGEKNNEASFVEELKKITQVYINDAFGTCHRKHASVFGLPLIIENKSMGLLLEKEIKYFQTLSHDPKNPFAAIVGGAKVAGKIGAMQALIKKTDKILIGGAMAYTFLAALGFKTGSSFIEKDRIDVAKQIHEEALKENTEILLPIDHICSESLNGSPDIVDSREIPAHLMGLDIGPKTIKDYEEALKGCNTIFWNGPMGVFENPDYSVGTFSIAKTLAKSQGIVVIGGGESVSAVHKAGVASDINHISTGGGASLEFIEFGTLPGVEALNSEV